MGRRAAPAIGTFSLLVLLGCVATPPLVRQALDPPSGCWSPTAGLAPRPAGT